MRLRTFTASDMPTAMRQVREALGDDAVILSSTEHKGKKQVSVTAAVEVEDYPSPRRRKTEQESHPLRPHPNPYPKGEGAADFLRFELQNLLRFHNLPDLFTAKLLQKAGTELQDVILRHGRQAGGQALFRMALEKLAEAYFIFEPLVLDGHGTRLMLVGPPGTGKTLSAARIAARLTLEQQPACIVTTDHKRAGGIEQLNAFTNAMGVELITADTPEALQQLVQALPRHTPLIVDTAGCNSYDRQELQELAAYTEIGVEPVLVLPAGGDSEEAIDLVEAFNDAIVLKRLLITRTDTARRFGGVMAAAAAHGLAFSHASQSASVVDPLKPMDGEQLAQFLLRYQLKS